MPNEYDGLADEDEFKDLDDEILRIAFAMTPQAAWLRMRLRVWMKSAKMLSVYAEHPPHAATPELLARYRSLSADLDKMVDHLGGFSLPPAEPVLPPLGE